MPYDSPKNIIVMDMHGVHIRTHTQLKICKAIKSNLHNVTRIFLYTIISIWLQRPLRTSGRIPECNDFGSFYARKNGLFVQCFDVGLTLMIIWFCLFFFPIYSSFLFDISKSFFFKKKNTIFCFDIAIEACTFTHINNEKKFTTKILLLLL